MITTVLFDLDGTILPLDNDQFTNYYFKLLCKKIVPHGFDAQELIDGVWAGTAAMVKNDGSRSNEEVFWEKFAEVLGERVVELRSEFEDFYRNEFNEAKTACGYDQGLVDIVRDLQKKGIRVALATNPIFPSFATENRIRWAGLEVSDFEMFTSYETIGFSKPNPEYYREVLRKMNITAEETIMVGNDASEDMVARELGMKVFLLTNHLINKSNVDITLYPHGNTEALRDYLQTQISNC